MKHSVILVFKKGVCQRLDNLRASIFGLNSQVTSDFSSAQDAKHFNGTKECSGCGFGLFKECHLNSFQSNLIRNVLL
ncbi:hypothetical protein TIFTF001_044851 [Ficus carica]|uniref:Uncharacterized protein n=1 Tax=Ficus carica TaxID=3494 RepID=A0AA87ZHQ7_FICCA|nr:hypothetical protein TIFTF001_044851 [Ficus carica]